MIEWAVYRRGIDGNVFDWILQASEVRRKLKIAERKRATEEAPAKSEVLDRPKVENQKW